MKIIFVTPEFVSEDKVFDGGLANYLYRVSKSLQGFGHTPIILTRSFSSDELIEFRGIKVYRQRITESFFIDIIKTLTFHKFDTSIYFQYMSYVLNSRLNSIIKLEDPDIIQFASYTGTSFYNKSCKPSVARISSYEKLHRIARGVLKPSLDEKRVESLESKALSRVDSVFGPSKLTNLAIERDLNIRVKTIESPFFIDVDNLNNEIYDNHMKDKRYILYFGSLSRLKGLLTIADIVEPLLRKYPDIYFVFAGKDIGMKSVLVQRAGDMKERLLFFESLAHDQLYPIIDNSELIVLPSLYDNFPNTCIEAMAHGKIVIGTRGTSFEQIIEHNVNGFLIEPGNSKDLMNTIDLVFSLNKDEKLSISYKAIERIDRLRPDKVVVELIDYYKEIIKIKSNG